MHPIFPMNNEQTKIANELEQRAAPLLRALYSVRCAADRGENIPHDALMQVRNAASSVVAATLMTYK